MSRAQDMAANFEGEANGALITSPQYLRRRRRQLQRIGMQQHRRARNGLEIVFEEDPNLNSEVEDECLVPTSRMCSYLSFMDQLKSGLGIKYRRMSPFILFLLLFGVFLFFYFLFFILFILFFLILFVVVFCGCFYI
ncbi:hypothetical protein MA16_Dca022855 [Dendrobium catenatum]|uniref:Uncharacterized protein n=1 Tax=Dendrobium catenatum TaxID=906689 RepID=A0A2I0X0B7_9ASPA|nr:hypothetical protein MA16_Dca022855 [Dendrobium catenatum]